MSLRLRIPLALGCLAILMAPRVVAARFTVCLFSFNSPDEVAVFRSWLPPADFEMVDLTPALLPTQTAAAARKEREGADSDSWLLDLCRPELQCDIVVYSGEFAGRFFGASGASLSLQAMEEAACASRCEGLFHAPREVFLLGCNTLATKDQDHRSPAEYLQVLLEHGFDRPSAERAVEMRYGPLGPSFREALRRIFAGVPRIYGFSSVAPQASYSVPRLDRYFRTKGSYVRWLEITGTSDTRNRELFAAFAGTDIAQTSGLRPSDPSDRDRERVCALYDETRSLAARLRIIGELLRREDMLSFVPTIEVFFNRHPAQLFQGEARVLFETIRANEEARRQVLSLVRDLGISASRLELAHLAHHLGWMGDEEFRALALDTVRQLLARPLSSDAVDIVCEVVRREPVGDAIVLGDLPPGVFAVAEGLRMIDCVRPADRQVSDRLLEALHAPDLSVRLWAAFALSHRLPLSEGQLVRLADRLRDDPPELRERLAWIFRMQSPLPGRVLTAVARSDPALAARLAPLAAGPSRRH